MENENKGTVAKMRIDQIQQMLKSTTGVRTTLYQCLSALVTLGLIIMKSDKNITKKAATFAVSEDGADLLGIPRHVRG